jgi:hypothetical protein
MKQGVGNEQNQNHAQNLQVSPVFPSDYFAGNDDCKGDKKCGIYNRSNECGHPGRDEDRNALLSKFLPSQPWAIPARAGGLSNSARLSARTLCDHGAGVPEYHFMDMPICPDHATGYFGASGQKCYPHHHREGAPYARHQEKYPEPVAE